MLRVAATVAEWADILRGSYWAKDADTADLLKSRTPSAEWTFLLRCFTAFTRG